MEKSVDSSFSFECSSVFGGSDSILWHWSLITRSHPCSSTSLQKTSSSDWLLSSRSNHDDRFCLNQTLFISRWTFISRSSSSFPSRRCLFAHWNNGDLSNQSMRTHSILHQQSFLHSVRIPSSLLSFHLDSSPIRYHHICRDNLHLLCFRDDVYLCLCAENQSRAECFLYDNQLDRCEHCRADGRCLQGNYHLAKDFVCLCPACYSGDRCQFNTKSFSFTLDQLFSPDLLSTERQTTISLLIFFSLFLFFLALPNNLFSFITLRRRSCLRFGIGHYLLWMSLVNQLNLLFFVARLIHFIMKITDGSSSSMLDDFLCKFLNYFLSSSTRLVYWLTSLISIERVYMTIFINGQWLKKPRIARRLIILTFVVVFLTDLYELFFYKSLPNLSTGQGSICVLEISKNHRTLWMTFHLLFLLLHSLLPFLINLFSTIIIIVIIVNKKMKTFHTKTRKLNISPRLKALYFSSWSNRWITSDEYSSSS